MLQVPVPQAVVAAAHGELETLLAVRQRLLQPALLAQHPLRQQDGNQHQQDSGADGAHHQQPADAARSLAQGIRECRLQRGQPSVEGLDPAQHRGQAIGIAAGCGQQAAQRERLLVQRLDLDIRRRPDRDGLVDFRDMAEIAV